MAAPKSTSALKNSPKAPAKAPVAKSEPEPETDLPKTEQPETTLPETTSTKTTTAKTASAKTTTPKAASAKTTKKAEIISPPVETPAEDAGQKTEDTTTASP
jgi:hypothetical protein